ncbi:hypothetical protein IQ03_00985 [Gemmobacter caeni]|uniref:TM2 domain-containing protein n=2 Tax=Gemmobacter TaxID=204456 RepID=A0A2T6B784_9RHOB|nr:MULTISPECIES: hypothetical protein [Gemmobacter]PTX51898.1 hypothetical protein C8N34_103404 [Gemmobacter caeni]TWJ04026.1 hypothetical protein IQ03_00985 [Gemmobacter caeni]GHC10847.1 hypothetical protein GCM10007291_04300 [Gemmobacter nanjingensis]
MRLTPPPPDPRKVLAAAIMLPGAGQVWNGEPQRGLIFLFFIFLLGGFTAFTAGPDISFVGRFAGGFFVWAMAIMDAYRRARIRFEIWRHANRQATAARAGAETAS